MPVATKASLQAELLAAQAELAALRGKFAALSEQQESPRTDELNQTLWLLPIRDGQGQRVNPNTGKVSFRFSAQVGKYDKRLAKYLYGATKNFVAYNNGNGDLATAIADIYESVERRVAITAFESPWADSSFRSDWTVTSLSVLHRNTTPTTSHQEVTNPEAF